MNPPLDPLDEAMYRELREDLRGLMRVIEKVHDNLDAHVSDEMKQYARVQCQLSELREEVVALKVKMGLIAATVSAFVAGFVAWGSKFFFP